MRTPLVRTLLNLDKRLIIRNNNNHLNVIIKYVEDNNNENICAYYEYLKYLREMIIKKLNVKKTTKDL